MRPACRFLIIVLLLVPLGCVSTRPQLDAVQTKQAGLREDIRQLEERINKTAGRRDELEKRIAFLEGNLTANIADLQKSVDKLSASLDALEAETAKKLKAMSVDLKSVSSDVEARFREMAEENRELLKVIDEARKSSFATGYEHLVESGETLGGIARSYGVTVEAIVEANDMGDPDTLKVGQKLFIPK